MSWNAATSGCEFNVMSSLTRFPDVALPFTTEADRRICGMHLCHKYFPSTRKHSKYLVQTTENTWLPVGTVPMPLTISAKLFVDIVRSSCPFKGRSMASRSRKPSTAQVARSRRHRTLEGKCEQAMTMAKANGQRKGVMVVSTRKPIHVRGIDVILIKLSCGHQVVQVISGTFKRRRTRKRLAQSVKL
ncbi:hypothetical protein EV363DRAFT_1238042, partial [Boletus edulis]